MACKQEQGPLITTLPYSAPGGFLILRVEGVETVACLSLQCRLPGGAVSSTARCAQCGLQYLWPMPTFVPIQAVEAAEDTALLAAELPGALWREATSPGEQGRAPVIKTEPTRKPVTDTVIRGGRAANHQHYCRYYSTAGVPQQQYSKKSATCRCRRRTEPSVAHTAAKSHDRGDQRIRWRHVHSTPWSGKQSPCLSQAPKVAEEGKSQAQAAPQRKKALPDIVVEEEVPVGDPTQDGGGTRACPNITSGGAAREMIVPRRSSSGGRTPKSKKSGRSTQRSRSRETGPGSGEERVLAPRILTVRPYPQTPVLARPQALVKVPAPFTFTFGSSSSLGMSGDSRVTSDERTGNLDYGTSDDGSVGGARITRQVSVSSDCPSNVSVTIGSQKKGSDNQAPSECTSGISSGVVLEEGDLEEESLEEVRETRWWAPLFEGYVPWMDRTRFIIDRDGVVDHWWAKGEFTEEDHLREIQERWYRIGRGLIEPLGPDGLDDPVDPEERLSWVLPGRAGSAKLTRACRAERAIIAKYKRTHGLEYPYVPELLMQEIEDRQDGWLREDVEYYMVTKGGCH
ncbi:hypothetical protein FKM82_025616 [Ascaphus truei]